MSFAPRSTFIAPGLLALLFPVLAHAHVGAGATHGFLAGIAHPIGGLDHVGAMVAVGLWAAQLGGRALWAVPLAFVAMMAGGSLLGFGEFGGFALPYAEQGIAVSVLLLGLLIAAALRLPTGLGAGLVGLFALFHGYAHGAEMPANAAGLTYGAGFILATAGLHVAGIVGGQFMQRHSPAILIRHTGLLIASYGGYLCLT